MKQYIVVGDSNGLFISIEAKFDNMDEAVDYAHLSRLSNERRNFTVYQKLEKQA